MNKFCIVVLLIACSSPANSQFSVELTAGTEYISAHVRVFKHIDKSNRWSLYSTNHGIVKYDTWKPEFFSANILAYNFRNGIGLGAVLVGGESGLYSSAAIQYKKTIKSLYIYFLSTHELNEFARQEIFFILGYKQKLSNRVNFIFHNENYISFRKWGYHESLQRIKSGFELGETQIGFISEISQAEKSHQTKLTNLGCYIKQSF